MRETPTSGIVVQPGRFPAAPKGAVQKTVSGGRPISQPDTSLIAIAWRTSSFVAGLRRLEHSESLSAGLPSQATERKARRLLARMDRMEEFAIEYENFDARHSDLPRWELECQRRNFAETYRRLVGVAPEDRHALRARLLALVAGT